MARAGWLVAVTSALLAGPLLGVVASQGAKPPPKKGAPAKSAPEPAKPSTKTIAKAIVAQERIGRNSCGPCALFHSLAWGDAGLLAAATALRGDDAEEKIANLIEDHGGKLSEAYHEKRPRFVPESGITWVDLGHVVDEVFAERSLGTAVAGYLDRDKDEPLAAHARRIHRLLDASLRAGMPPILSLRSFAAQRDDKEWRWNAIAGHWVTVVEVQADLADDEAGFRLGYVDPDTGKLLFGYAFADQSRNFVAAKGDDEAFEWRNDRAFLVLAAPRPAVRTDAVNWYERTVVTLNFAITRGKRG